MHLLLMVAVNDPDGVFGRASQLTPPGAICLATYAVLALMIYVRPAFRGKSPGMVARGTAALMPIPLYLLSFPSDWSLCLVGMLTCLLQGHYMLLAHPEHDDRQTEWADSDLGEAQLQSASVDLVITASVGTAVIVLLMSGHHITDSPIGWAAAWTYVVVATAVSLTIEYRDARPGWKSGPFVEPVLLGMAITCAATPPWHSLAMPLFGLRQLAAVGRLWKRERGIAELWHSLTERPARLLVLSFAAAIVAGTLVISLPAASNTARGLSAVDSLFTATSAICVTGLIVVDTAVDLTPAGQTFVLGMIQVGGLGIMTISMFLAVMLGRRVGLRSEFAIGEMIGEERSRMVTRLLRFIIFVTLTIEAAGAVVLTAGFRSTGMSLKRSLCFGIFHSVSAFCNAGFALISDSFMSYADMPLFPLCLSVLIILGGLGFGVLFTVLSLAATRRARIGPHVKLVLIMTAVLSLGGALLFYTFERDGVLAGMTGRDALVNAWFQSVTTRTAGFNTVDMSLLAPATDLLMRILMFVGAAPGSTGGGIKVTTAVILVLLVRSIFLGRKDVVVLGRRIESETVINAAALFCISLSVLLAAVVLLLATQPLPPGRLVFEAVSALGTVGLSQGVTAQLNPVGKLIIIGLMFVGRVGPLSLLVMMRPRTAPTVNYPSAKVMIG
jgi:trk system potassium uptake protein TrkH